MVNMVTETIWASEDEQHVIWSDPANTCVGNWLRAFNVNGCGVHSCKGNNKAVPVHSGCMKLRTFLTTTERSCVPKALVTVTPVQYTLEKTAKRPHIIGTTTAAA